MRISELCIHRPVLASVLSLVVILFGLLGYFNLETRYFPNIDQHVIVIETSYAGASSKLIEKVINTPIEDAMSVVSGIDIMTSAAQQGFGKVKIKFNTGVDFTEKASEVRDKLSEIRNKLPSDIEPPTIDTHDDTGFLMNLAFTDPNLKPEQIRDYLDQFVKDKIQEVTGVGELQIWGSSPYAMRIWLDAKKMEAYKVTVRDIRNVLENNNVQSPAGKFKSSTMYFPITEDTKLHSAKEFNQLVVADRNGHLIRLQDVGHAELGLSGDPFYARINGVSTVGMNVFLEPGANPITASERLHSAIKILSTQLPVGMKIQIPQDTSRFYKEAVHEVYVAIGLAILCVLLVIFLLLGDLRSVFIPIITIPICVVGAFGIIALFNFSINLLTLLAIVLSIGLVVDDAIVMLENIYRNIEKGLTPFKAAIVGSKEITFSIVAMSMTLIAVYAPIGFMNTRTSILFRQFAFTLAGAVFISGFVALTLTPSMCAMLLQKVRKQSRYAQLLENGFFWLRDHYRNLLKKLIHYRLIVLIFILVIASGGFFIVKTLSKEFMPKEDLGMIFSFFTTPSGSNTDYTFNFSKQIGKIVSEDSDVASIYNFVWDDNIRFFLLLKPINQRKRSADIIAAQLTSATKVIPNLKGYFFPVSFFSGMSGSGVKFDIMTTGTYEDLYREVQQVEAKLRQNPNLIDVDSNMRFDSQQYNITINRDLAETEGVNVKDIDDTLATLLGGSHITDFYLGDNSYDVMVQAKASDLVDPSVINNFYVKGATGKMVPLVGLVTLQPIVSQDTLSHYDRLRSATITAQLKPDYQLSRLVKYLQVYLPQWLPSNMKYAFEGKAKHLIETSNDMNLLFGLALVFIYLILAALFESFIDPFIILLTVPLSVIGGLFALMLIGGTLNLYTDIGLVTLVGLITKHGILITQFANERLKDGKSVLDAITEAASLRLRPILMTTGAMVLGALPLALATGSGANSRSQIGWVIISGLLCGTFFSLILVPIAYTYLARFKRIKKIEH